MKTKVKIHRVLFVLYLAGIIWLCIHNFSDLGRFPHTIFGLHTDKLVHFAMFFPFPFFAYLSYDKRRYTLGSTLLFLLASTVLGLLLATGTEIAQSFIPYRTSDFKDLVADAIAIAAGCVPVLIADLSSNSRHNHKHKH